ncbi:MAG: hypothetical protein M3Q29_24230 [Chloroflexota bacterium]|nr:hypothetical protein [Chloroflexota bacterium]
MSTQALRVAYLHIPEFEIAVERSRASSDGPLVLGGSAHDRNPVRRASQEAVAEGVREGMPLREAAARCPQASFLPYDTPVYEETSRRVLETLRLYSDAVEPDGLGSAYLDASGWGSLPTRLRMARELVAQLREGLFTAEIREQRRNGAPCPPSPPLIPPRTPEGNHKVRRNTLQPSAISACSAAKDTVYTVMAGLAPTKFAARLTARSAPTGEVVAVPDWMQTVFLGEFPVEELPLGERNLRRLRRLGVRTVAEFTALPAAETKLQFGAEGCLSRALATGETWPVNEYRNQRWDITIGGNWWTISPPHNFGELREREPLDPPVEDAQTVRRVVERRLASLRDRLGPDEAAGTVEVSLELEDSPARSSVAMLPFPSASTADLSLAASRALDRLLVADTVPAVQAVEVRLLRIVPETGRQASLWDVSRPAQSVATTLSRLREQFGPDRLCHAVPGDPASPLVRKQFALVTADAR